MALNQELMRLVDALGAEYGWTKDETFQLSRRQIDSLLESLEDRKEKENRSMKTPSSPSKPRFSGRRR